jgi:hypothetical protein
LLHFIQVPFGYFTNAAAKWKEELHPREADGKFGEKGAGHVSSAVAGPNSVRAKQAASSPGQKPLGLAGDAAEQIGMPTGRDGGKGKPTLPAQLQGEDQPFMLSGKPVKGKATFPGSGATKQVDLFAGRGDAPGQMSFGDDIDPASKPVADQGEPPPHKHPDKPLSPREAEILADLHKTYKGLSGAELVDMAQTIAHKEKMSIDPDRGDALSTAQENRRRRDEAKRGNEAMVPKLNANLTPPPPSSPVATAAAGDADDPHLSRAAEVVKRIPKVTAKGLSVQLNGEVSEEHAAELLAKLRGGGAGGASGGDGASEPSKPAEAKPAEKAARPREYSDQEIGLREAERTAGEVLADPTKASLRDLNIAGGHLRHQIKVEGKRLERGDISKEQHDALVDSYQREVDHIDSLQRDYINGRKVAPADDMSRAEKIAEQAHIEGKSIHTVAKEQGLTHQEFADIIEETGKHLGERKKLESESGNPAKRPSEARAKAMERSKSSELADLQSQAAKILVDQRQFHPDDAASYAAKLGSVKELKGFIADNPPEHSPAMQSAIAAAHQQLHEAGLAEKPE